MKNNKHRKCGCADNSAEHRTENRADQKNNRAARATRKYSPDQTDKRRNQEHFCPGKFLEFLDGFADKLAGKKTDHGGNQIYDKKYSEKPKIVTVETSGIGHEFCKESKRRKCTEH